MTAEQRQNRRLELPEGPLRASCVAALEGVLGYAAARLEDANTDAVTAVHEYRKSLRRARSLLRMLRPVMSRRLRRRIDVPIKEAHRSLSGARDQAVLRDTWERLSEATGVEVAAIDAGLRREPPPLKITAKTLRRFDDLIALLDERLEPEIDVADIGRGLARTYRAARRELRRAETIADPAHVHALRRRCKDLNYQLEALTTRFRPKRVGETRKAFASLAKRLGQITDLYQLRAAIAAMPGPIEVEALGLANASISEAIELKLADSLADAAEALASKPKSWLKSLKLAS